MWAELATGQLTHLPWRLAVECAVVIIQGPNRSRFVFCCISSSFSFIDLKTILAAPVPSPRMCNWSYKTCQSPHFVLPANIRGYQVWLVKRSRTRSESLVSGENQLCLTYRGNCCQSTKYLLYAEHPTPPLVR
ncbi:hypothetical protein DPMN_035462 [Dreissena polymorpha]|uniref:Uncharacterized protein n=1 Tax=Dreissena polymorpha TaxID=45954 RepID=A0A9D4MB02_DREPO|nr:hypothetical protein DPMN_035462 [Dreissena polymorpha]